MKRIALLSIFFIYLNLGIAQTEEGNGWFLQTSSHSPIGTFSANTATFTPTQITDIEELDLDLSQHTTPMSTEEANEDLVKLAKNLGNDLNKIYDYVKNNIKTELYYGIKKGAVMTLYDGAGNDYDKVNLFIELCKAAGFPNIFYFLKCVDVIPIQRSENTYSLESLTGLDVNSDNSNLSDILDKLRGIKCAKIHDENNIVMKIAISRIKLAIVQNGTLRALLDILKNDATLSQPSTEFNIPDLKSIAGGNISTSQVASIDEAELYKELNIQSYELRNILEHNAALDTCIGGLKYSPEVLDTMASMYLEPFYGYSNTSAFIEKLATFSDASYLIIRRNENNLAAGVLYRTIPEADYFKLKIEIKSTNNSVLASNSSLKLSDLNSRRLWMYFNENTANIQFDSDSPILSTNISATDFLVKISITHPRDIYSSTYSNEADIVYFSENTYKKNDNYLYNIAYAFSASDTLLTKRRNKFADMLSAAQSSNLIDSTGNFVYANTNTPVLSQAQKELIAEGLNVMGLDWMLQTHKANQLIAGIMGCDFGYIYRLGRIAQEGGYYIDVGLQTTYSFKQNGGLARECFAINAIISSAFEHAVIQQTQQDADAISTVNILHYANDRSSSIPLVLLDNPNFNSDLLTGYSSTEIQSLRNDLSAESAEILIPQNRQATPTGTVNGTTWDWNGYGYILLKDDSVRMAIAGNLQGGYTPSYGIYNPISTYQNYSPTNYYAYNPAASVVNVNTNISTITRMPTLGADPVDLNSGAYVYNSNDINIGTLNFKRQYNSNLSNQNKCRLGYGWTHNYDISIAKRSAPEVVLGDGNLGQMSDFITGICAMKSAYCTKPDSETAGQRAQRLATTAFIAKWTVDAILGNAYTLTMGKEIFQFIKTKSVIESGSGVQVIDTYLSPIGTNLRLEKEGDIYMVKEPYGNTFRFNSDNKIEEIEDISGRKTLFTYDTNTKNLLNVKDIYNKQINFTYNDAGNIFRVSDNANSSHFVEFTYDTNSDLTTVSNSLGIVGTYVYDEHKITVLKNSTNQVIVQNAYDDTGSVSEQLSSGDPAKKWTMFYAGTYSEEQDPLGNIKRYEYDANGLCTAIIDQLGNTTHFEYDSQYRLVKKTFPNGDEVRTTYDKWHNKLSEDIYENHIEEEGDEITSTLVWKSGVSYEYEDDDSGELPRLVSVTQKSAEDSTSGRTESISAYLTLDGKKTTLPLSKTGISEIITNYTYDSLGNVLSESIGGLTTTYTYANAQFPDKPTKITHPNGLEENISYNANGDVLTHSSKGLTTEYSYDILGRTIAQKEYFGSYTSNNPYRVTTTTYDNNDNVITEISPSGITTTYTWNPQKKLLSTTISNGGITQTTINTLDLLDRIVQTNLPDGKIINYTLDEVGNTLSETSAQRTNTYTYDVLGRRTSITTPLGCTSSQVYDALNNVITDIDGRGNPLYKSYNPYNELVSLTNREGGEYLFQNNIAEHYSTLTTPQGHTIRSNYNAQTGQLTSVVSPTNQQTSYTYNSGGELTGISDASGSQILTYDATTKNVATITENNDTTLSYTYDALGRVSSSTYNGYTILYEYTLSDKISKITYPAINGLSSKIVQYTYDSMDRLASVTDWSGRQILYTYDNGNRLTRVDRANGTYASYSYDNSTKELLNISERYSNGDPIAITALKYDNDSRIIKRIQAPNLKTPERDNVTIQYDTGNRISIFNGNSLTYDNNGNMTYGPIEKGELHNFAYDSRNRLISLNGEIYSYDVDNLRTSVEIPTNNVPVWNEYNSYEVGDYVSCPNVTSQAKTAAILSISVDPEKLILTITTDTPIENTRGGAITLAGVNGDITVMPVEDDNTNTTSYIVNIASATWYISSADHSTKTYVLNTIGLPPQFNYLIPIIESGADTVTLAANSSVSYSEISETPRYFKAIAANDGSTVEVTDTDYWEYLGDTIYSKNEYLYTKNSSLQNVLIRTQRDHSNQVLSTTYYVYGAGLEMEVSVQLDGEGQEVEKVKYYHYDNIGSTVAMTDSTGKVSDRFSYEPWGLSYHTLGSSDSPFRYVGKYGVQTDSSKLLYMRARYYNPLTMRFINADPSGFDGGMNWYLYGNGNPLRFIDISGNASMDAMARGYYTPFDYHTANRTTLSTYEYNVELNPAYKGYFFKTEQGTYESYISAFPDPNSDTLTIIPNSNRDVGKMSVFSQVTYKGTSNIPMSVINVYYRSIDNYANQLHRPRYSVVLGHSPTVGNCNTFTASAYEFNNLQVDNWPTFTYGRETRLLSGYFSDTGRINPISNLTQTSGIRTQYNFK